jgi:lysophospholipase L1-like esterase
MRLAARNRDPLKIAWALLFPCLCVGAGFFTSPGKVAGLTPVWEKSEIGVVWSDDFNRAFLGPNWVILGGADASISGNQLMFSESRQDLSRQVYYDPWPICSDSWTLRWSERFSTLNTKSTGVGIGIKNFQSNGGNDRSYNAILGGAGSARGKMQIQRFDGAQQLLVSSGPAMSLSAGNIVDCSLTRSGWTLTAVATNRANGQISIASIEFSDAAGLLAPTLSRVCFYPLVGTVYFDDLSFTINHRKPARFTVVGGSISEGYNASSYSNGYVRLLQTNYPQTICNDSSSFNTTSDAVSSLPEILAHQPTTVLLMIGGNDVQMGSPPDQWQAQYSNLVAQLRVNGAIVKHCLPTPRTNVDLTLLKDWILTNYPTGDVIDTWTPLLSSVSLLNTNYDSGDGIHPNDAGHAVISKAIRANLP